MSKIERFLSDPRYQALDDAGKKEKLDLFFNKYVTQDARYSLLDEEGKARVYSKFMSKYYGEHEAKAPKQKTPFSGLKSELKGTMSLMQSAEAISTGEVETQTLDRRNKAYQKVMADREEALRIIDRERNLKQAIPQDRVAAGQQFIKKVKSMQVAPKYPIKSQYTAAMERLQPNNYTDPIERQVAHEIVNKEKLDKAQREYQRIAERTASATPEERKEIAKSLAAQQTLIDYYATGMTAAERAAYQAGQEGSESFRMVKALGTGSIDLASSVYQLFNPDSKFARTINAYSAGLLEQSGNPLEDAFAQVFYSMPMTLGYFMTGGISAAAGTATKAAAIATKAGEVASLMHSVNINAYMTAKKYSDAISGYGSATAVPEGVFLAGSTAALVESSIEMLSDTAQAKIVLGQAKRIGRRGAEQIIKNSLRGKISGYGTRLATGMAESAITEFTEEILQGASGMIFDVMSNQREVPSLEEAFKELMYSGAVGALGGITFGLGGGIMVQSSNYQNWREVKKQAASGNDHAARLWEARSILDKSNPNGEVWKSDVQRAYDVIKSDLHAVAENRYQEDNPSIAQAMAQMYDAYAMVDMIKSPQQEAVREAIEAGVQRVLDQKKATAIQEPTQQAAATEPQSVEDTIVNLVQEGDIEAAENALNEAIKNGTTGINIPYLRTLVNESKAVAARIAKEEADQKARQDIIDKYGKYAEMSHSELQDEAKKRGLKAGGKSTDIMARLKESDEKPKAETTPAKPAAKKPLTTNEPTEQQQDRSIKESLITEEAPKKVSKYESMGYNALQKEAKKRGLNSFGVKKAELIRQLEEKDSSTGTAPVKAAEDSKAGTQDIDKLYNRIKTTVAGKNSQDVYILKRDLGLLLMPKVRIQEAESVADYYIALREGIVTQAEYDNYIDELIAENRVNDASDAEKSAARKRVDAYRNKKAEDSKPKPQTPKDDGYIRISIGDLIEHYKAMGMDRQRAWKEYIQDTVLSKRVITDSIDAKDFMPYFDRIQFPQKSDKMMPAPVKAEGVEADASVERARTDTKPEPQKTKAAPAPDQFADTSKMIEAEISKRDEAQRRNIDKAIADGYDTLDVTSADLRGSWYLTKKGKKNVTPMVWVSEQNLKYAENALANKPEAKEDVVKPEAELNVLKKELADINRTLSLLKEEYDRLLKIAPDDRTAEQDKRIEYIDDLSKTRTIRKSEIETEIAGYESQKSDKMMPKQQTADPVKTAEDSKSEVMSRSNFQEQYRQAQEGKLPKGQIDAQLKLYDAMMDTYAKEMGITIDEAYAEVIDSVTADEPVEGTARRSGARYQTTDMPSAAEIAEAERQMAEVRAKYEGTDQWLKAPNGKPTKLNERQWLQVRTQNFKDWFGDWENDPNNASKVVDENGEPLVVYHGTGTYKEFSKTHIFNPEMLGTVTNAESAKKGFFFAESKGTAVEYAGLDQIEAPFRSWLDMPNSINEIIGDIRKVILETDAEYVPSTVWEAYGQFVEDIFNSKSNEERLELYLSFKNNESLYHDVMEQEIPQDIIDDAEESLLQDRGFYVERVEGDEDYQEYLEAKEEIQDNAYDLARSIFFDEKIGLLSGLFSGADRNKLEPHIRKFDFSKQYDPNDFKIMQVFLSVKNPLDYYFKEGYRDEKFNDLMQKAIADNKDGAIFRNVKDGGGFDNIYVAIGNTQIKSATANVGTFSESNADIRFQQLIRGYIQKMPNGKYRIGIMQPNVTTGLHEQAHLGKSLMEIMANKSPAWASRLKAAEEWCGVKDGKWTTEAEEKFANGYVKFLADGSAPNGKLKTIFAKIKEWIGSILQGLADVRNLDVSNEMRGVYLSMLGISEGKRNLTSEQKVLSIKLKSAMKQDTTSDPLKLEAEIDRFANNNMLILEGKRTGNKTSFYLNRIDDGKTMIEIHHSKGEYEVNGYHAANNQEVMEQVTRILGDTRYQITDMPSAAEIAEAERQMAEVRAKYEGTDQWMKAPNGKPTKLNERQWLQVRTQNFKDWFGDWENDPKNASKVVDGNGEPLVVYHGSGNSFNEFMFSGYHRDIDGYYFSSDKNSAMSYTDLTSEFLYEVFLNVRNPIVKNYKGSSWNSAVPFNPSAYNVIPPHDDVDVLEEDLGYLKTIDGLVQLALSNNHDGVIAKNIEDQGENLNYYAYVANTYVAFSPNQIKSAAANVGTFSESNDIRYQIDRAVQSASPDMQDRIAKIMEKQKKVQQAANATYRELTTKIGRTTSVYEWDSLMRKSLVTAIRNAFPGAAPMNIEKYAALEETLGELDPGLEDHAKEIIRIKAQLRRMVAMDKKFRDALEDVSGFSDIADIPFEGLFSALENTNPAAYDRYFKDETFDILLKALPKIKTAYDGQFTMQTLQRIVDVILNGNDPNVGRDVSELAFLQPQRLFAELFGKAGINTINYAYHGTLKLAAYEMEYTPHLKEINRLLMTADNNRGSAYDGDDLDIIGRTIFEVDGNSEISNKLETIQERLAEWAEENNAVINSKDVEEIYNEKEYLKDIMRGFIAEWNANPERTQKIGIREDYDNPRKYNWGDISDITTKGGKYLYTPGNARERSKQDFSDGLDYDTNIFNAYSNYMYSMTRYMAFYDLANYVEGSSILYTSKGGKAGQKKMASGFDLDLSLAQHKSSAYASKMIEDYVRNTIGYHKKDTPKGRLLAAARTNVYASLLASNVIMTVLNFNQRNLIHSVVDQNIAMQVKTDVAFWTGLFKPSNEEYPTLSGIMQAYVTANQSLIADLAAEAKRSANQGRTALTRAYYKHTAYNAEILRLSPFSLAELGNRAYAHAAGVYQVTQNSMAYKEYVASGMSRHQAMERALSEDSNLRRAAITYGGIINAEINADANRAFSPHFFGDASKIKKVATFLRYGVTIALLELRTYGGARDIKSLLSPDLFRLLTSGNVKAATAAQTIQAGAIMKSMLHPKRIAELVRRGQVSTAKTSKNLITVNEVNMVRDAITWALDEQAKYTEEEFHNIIRGKSGAKRAMAALMAFSVSEVLLRSLLELLFSLIPWWQGKKKFIETDVIENIASVLGLFQGLKTASNVRLGSTLAPDLGAYNPTAKTTTKALSQYVLRLTPYAGLANYMGKVFTGKYFSDLFWDEVYD